jgi:hypothetical protein
MCLRKIQKIVESKIIYWGPEIPTSARIGSPGPGRFHYTHCGWVPLRPSDSDFSQNWKPRTGEIPLLSLWLGAIEAQWFWLQPELGAQDRGDSHTLTVVGCHWGPDIPTSARIGSPGPGRFPYSHCVGCHWGPVILISARIGSPGPGRFPYSFQMIIPRGILGVWIIGFDKPVKLHCTCEHTWI